MKDGHQESLQSSPT